MTSIPEKIFSEHHCVLVCGTQIIATNFMSTYVYCPHLTLGFQTHPEVEINLTSPLFANKNVSDLLGRLL